MSTAERGLELVALIEGSDPDIHATTDPRSATPPCVLVTPPSVAWDGMCSGTATWVLYALTVGPANFDAWTSLDKLLAVVAKELPVEAHRFVQYRLANDQPPCPAYRIEFTQGVETP
jgi:hypothetical protein